MVRVGWAYCWHSWAWVHQESPRIWVISDGLRTCVCMDSSRLWVSGTKRSQDHSGNMGQFSFGMNLEPRSMGSGLKSMSSGASVVRRLIEASGLRELTWCWGGLKTWFCSSWFQVGPVWKSCLQHLHEAPVLGAWLGSWGHRRNGRLQELVSSRMFWEPGFTGAHWEPGVIRAVWECWIWQVLESFGGLIIKIHQDPGAGMHPGLLELAGPGVSWGLCLMLL